MWPPCVCPDVATPSSTIYGTVMATGCDSLYLYVFGLPLFGSFEPRQVDHFALKALKAE